MDILDKIEHWLPILANYPRWAQILFVSTLALALVSLFVFIMLFASVKRVSADAPDQVKDSVQQRLTAIDQCFGDVGQALTNYYTTCVVLRMHFLDYTEQHTDLEKYFDNELPDDLQKDVSAVIAAQGKLISALSAVQRDSFLRSCWVQAVADAPSDALTKLRDRLLELGLPSEGVAIDIRNIQSITQFFSVSSQRLGAMRFSPLLMAVLETNMADTPSANKHYDNAALRSFIFGGNLLFGRTEKSDGSQAYDMLVMSFGSAILLDIYHSLPKPNSVKKSLELAYPEYKSYIEALKFDEDPNTWLSDDLKYALDQMEKHRDLILLEIPPTVPATASTTRDTSSK